MREHGLAEQFEDIQTQHRASLLGMWVFLGSETLLFLALFALFAAYRVMYLGEFSRAAAHNNVIIGTVNTLVLITSSLTVALAVYFGGRLQGKRAAALLGVSVLFGLVFLGLKGMEYAQHFREGIFPGSAYHFAELPGPGGRLFFTLYYLMTGLHGLHVVVGMGMLSWIAVGAWQGRYHGPGANVIELGGLYWHLIDVVWIFLWPLLYLSHT